jgi:hypothetical protein
MRVPRAVIFVALRLIAVECCPTVVESVCVAVLASRAVTSEELRPTESTGVE